jgi:hypothetical protein
VPGVIALPKQFPSSIGEIRGISADAPGVWFLTRELVVDPRWPMALHLPFHVVQQPKRLGRLEISVELQHGCHINFAEAAE